MRPGSTTAMYWSAVATLVAIVAPTRLDTSATADFAPAITGAIRRSSAPIFSTTPPNASATMMSHTVSSMRSMPPRVTSVSIAGMPDWWW